MVGVLSFTGGENAGRIIAMEGAKRFAKVAMELGGKSANIIFADADFDRALNNLRESYPDYKFIPITIPIGAEGDFKGVVNLLTQKAYYGAGKDRSDLPEEMADMVEAARLELVEAAAESDNDLLEKYFEEETLSDEEIRDGMRKAAREGPLETENAVER